MPSVPRGKGFREVAISLVSLDASGWSWVSDYELGQNPHLAYLNQYFDEVAPLDFYRSIFPSGELDRRGAFTNGKYTAIAVRVQTCDESMEHELEKPIVKRFTVTDDLLELNDVLLALPRTDDFCVMSPVSYAGKSQKQANARKLHAITIDLDGLYCMGGCSSLASLFSQIDRIERIPRPTYIVSSGTGVHLYYVLDEPIRLFPNTIKNLAEYRRRLTWLVWHDAVTTLDHEIQYESVTQGFRMVGSSTKTGLAVRAFETGDKVSVDYMNSFAGEGGTKIETEYRTSLTVSKAREMYPEWYEKRIVQGLPRETWRCKRDLYEWWKRKIDSDAKLHHRYWCVFALAAYARKCGVSYEELESDALSFLPYLNSLGVEKGEPFTADEMYKALGAYDVSWITYPRHTIAERTDIEIPPNKRNGRKLEQHMVYLNGLRKMRRDILGEDEYKNSGRPNKRDAVLAYRAKHPDATQREIAAALGMSKTTVNKWLKAGD